MPPKSYVVTGGAHGIGYGIATRLAADPTTSAIILDTSTTLPTPTPPNITLITGSASDELATMRAAAAAERLAPLAGWVNNAAVFADASFSTHYAQEILELVTRNLAMTVHGAGTAIKHFVRHGRGGSVVNVSSHQAGRPVKGAMPYATAKAAVEGFTRAAAVDHGADGVRVNAVALGSIDTERLQELRAREGAGKVDAQMAALHPLGRAGTVEEVADVVEFLLSPAAGFITGVVLPVDGGRSVNGPDPEAA